MTRKRTGRNGYRHYYSNTSSALEISAIQAYTMGRQHKGYQRIHRTSPRYRVKARRATLYKDVGQTHAKFSRLSVATIVIIFLCAIGLALSYAALYSKSLRISTLSGELKQKREQNAVLEAEISKSYDLKEIERIATTKLGMAKPKAHQIIHIYVPKQSYTVPAEDTAPSGSGETSPGLFGSFFTTKE